MSSLLRFDKNILVCSHDHVATEYADFCGTIVTDVAVFQDVFEPRITVYAAGNISEIITRFGIPEFITVLVVQELSYNYKDEQTGQLIETNRAPFIEVSLAELPVHVYGLGVLIRECFSLQRNLFESVVSQHEFQFLTESDKPGVSYRKGVYLTEVTEVAPVAGADISEPDLRFKLLRCSTNMNGPTNNFRAIDTEIVAAVNGIAANFYDQPAQFNHVLAQIYTNTRSGVNQTKEVKAKIKAHSDKTKDMPDNALIAFCTFYDKLPQKKVKPIRVRGDTSNVDPFDYRYKDASVLTKLRFKLKECVSARETETDARHCLPRQFEVTLYPNSMFIIDMATNRLYTHETVPPVLPIERIPTRMGYIVRCSKTEAVYKNGLTHIKNGASFEPLLAPTPDDLAHLRRLYSAENSTEVKIDYGFIPFSMNNGDYMKPIL